MENVRSIKLQSVNQEYLGGSAAVIAERPDIVDYDLRYAGGAGQVVKEREVPKQKSKRAYEAIKRVFDIIGSGLGMIVLIPVFLVISILIKAERSGKHVFYKQRRIGKGGKEIYIFKFRSMVDNADQVEKWLNKKQLKQYYREYKVDNDPRVTKIGKFLRRTGLDELPQILNIFRGELSIVGPRPIQEKELAFYGSDKDLLLSIRPGLTGYWQVYCCDGITYSGGKRQKMELDYVRGCNLWWDIKLIFATFGALLKKVKRGQ